MKILHIHAKSNQDIIPVLKKIKLKGKVGLITTIQCLHQLEKAKKIIKNSVIGGQILGCDVSNAIKIKDKVDSFLYIGSGEFHPLAVAQKTNKPVFTANPITNEISKISNKDIENIKKNKKGKLIKFLSSNRIGILVSKKSGQYQLKKAIQLQKKLNKQSYIFLFDTLDNKQLENFPDIECWVNTACPRIEGKNIINLEELPN